MLIRDRDAKFAAGFDYVLAAEGMEVHRTPAQSPRANSIAERWVASARREALDWLLVLNDRHLRVGPTAASSSGHRPAIPRWAIVTLKYW